MIGATIYNRKVHIHYTLDLFRGGDIYELIFSPGMKLDSKFKLSIFEEMLFRIKAKFKIPTLRNITERIRNKMDLELAEYR